MDDSSEFEWHEVLEDDFKISPRRYKKLKLYADANIPSPVVEELRNAGSLIDLLVGVRGYAIFYSSCGYYGISSLLGHKYLLDEQCLQSHLLFFLHHTFWLTVLNRSFSRIRHRSVQPWPSLFLAS